MATEISDSDRAALSSPRDDWAELRARLPQFADKLKADRPLLDSLGLKPASRNLIDFGPAALARLEAKALKDIDVRRQMEATARANFDAQNQTHGLVLSLLEARNHSDLARRLNEEAKHRFGLVAATIALEDTGPVPLGWKTLDYGGVDYIIGEEALSLLGPDAVARVLFDEEVKRIKSAAILRVALWRDGRPGLVCFGSAEFDGFTPDMGAELVAFVARVVERVVEWWPVL